jgi:outer membrane beta-barrel protein
VKNATRLSAFVLVLLSASLAQAQEVQLTGPLAGAPAVRKLKMYRQGRISLTPSGYFSVNDEFRRHIMAGGRIEYNIFDFLALGVFGAKTIVGLSTSLADEVKSKGVYDELNYPYSDPDHPDARQMTQAGGNLYLDNQLGLIDYVGGVQASLIPFRGKFSLFARAFIDADAFLFLGVGAAGVRERADVKRGEEDVNPLNQSGAAVDTTTRTHVAPTFGGGLNFYLSEFIALSIEYRMMPFAWNTSGTDEAGSARHAGQFPDDAIDADDDLMHFNQFFTIGVAFHLPTSAGTTE